MAEETGAPVAGALSDLGRPQLGPWMATTRIRQPRLARASTNPRKGAASNLDSSDTGSSPLIRAHLPLGTLPLDHCRTPMVK